MELQETYFELATNISSLTELGSFGDANLAVGEGVEPSSSSSKPDVLPVAPSRKGSLEFLVASFELMPVCNSKLETYLVVGVGIEPTFRVFQTRANPSQLSDPRNWS
jgi:hypothetical protein